MITIIILIILATVTINSVFGENGLVEQAKYSKDYTSNSTESDLEGMNRLYDEYANVMTEDSEIPVVPKVPETVEEAKPDEGRDIYYFENTTEIKDDSGDSVWIPGGFGITEDSSTDADDGVVIQDQKGNEFVWIPVPDYTTMYEDTQGSVTLTGVTTTTNVYSKLRIRSGDSYIAGIPGNTSSVRESDVLSYYDTDEQYYSILGYSSTQEMADGLVEEYTATYNSIKKYKGFYIGRYELTGTVDSPTVQKGQAVLTNQNWYNLKKACSNVVSTEYAQSEMIYGNQWDEVMNWLKETVFKDNIDKVDVDSSSWENSPNVDVYNSEGTEIIKNSGISTKLKTGVTTFTMRNNIYDIAGNCWEWTQEAYNIDIRIIRGRSL